MRAMHATAGNVGAMAARIAVTLAVLFAVPTFAAAPVAHADDASYLARLNASGVPIPGPDDVRLNTGRYVCGQLRMYTWTGTLRPGSNPEVVRQLTNVFLYSPAAAQTQIDAAQAELCPDTLRR